jgi:DnaJ family protein C protein 13
VSSSSSGAPADPPGFCKALVRFLYERLVERCFRGSKLGALSPKERADCLEVLTALTRLLTSEPRLLGLLASKSAVGAVVAALAPAANTWPPLMQAADKAAAAGAGGGAGGGGPLAAAAAAAGAGAGDGAAPATSTGQQETQQQQQQQQQQPVGPADSPQQLAADAERLAASALSLLLLLSQSAPVLDALVDEPFVRQLTWLLVAPPSFRVLELTLTLLKSVAPTATAAVVAGYQGGAVLLLNVLLHQGAWPWPGGEAPSPEAEAGVVAAAAGVLGRVMAQAGHGPRVVLLLGQLLPPGLVAALQEGPEEGVVAALHTVRNWGTAGGPCCMLLGYGPVWRESKGHRAVPGCGPCLNSAIFTSPVVCGVALPHYVSC